jgi:alcohol dehydrogenase class IV
MDNETVIRKFVSPEIVYGVGASSLVGQYINTYGAERVMVVSDPGVMAAGWAESAIAGVSGVGAEAVLFSEVSANPRDHEVMQGVELYRAHRCDAIVVVGGGSPIDCAKGIGIVVSNNRHILEYEGVDHVGRPMPPLICIPTTAGSSADVSQFAIINDTSRLLKIAIISKSTVPDVTLIDPSTTVTMDPYLTACTGMDALVHAVEAYVSNAASPLTDLHALQAIRLISANLLTAIGEPDNLVARNGMMLASLEAGLAFSNASLGAVHAMAHCLGGMYDFPHGECNALLLEHVIRFNYQAAPERYRDIAAALTKTTTPSSSSGECEMLVAAIRDLRIAAGITRTFGLAGVTSETIPDLADKAMHDACMVTNPRRPTRRDIEEIYEHAL